jgi:hypothetical protein
MRRYGAVADGLKKELDPRIEKLIALIKEMEHILGYAPSATSIISEPQALDVLPFCYTIS